MPRHLVSLVLGALTVLAAAAGPTGPAHGQEQTASSPQGEQTESPWFLPRMAPRRAGASLQRGLRIEHGVRGLSVSRETFQQGGEATGMALPGHLGGGFLFFQSLSVAGASATAFYRAETWTGELQPLGSVPFAVQQVHAGFDRLYVFGTAVQVAIDAGSGDLLPLEPLPPVATVENLAFFGSQALIEAPLVGVLWTPDSGLTWRPLPGAISVRASARGLLVQTVDGERAVDVDGSLRPVGALARRSSAEPPVSLRRVRSLPPHALEAELAHVVRAGLEIAREDRKGAAAVLDSANASRGEAGSESARRWLALGQGRESWVELTVEGAGKNASGATFRVERIDDARVPEGSCLGTDSPPDRALFLCEEDASESHTARFESRGRAQRLVERSSRGLRTRARLSGGPLWARGDGAFLVTGDCQSARRDAVCWVTAQGARAVALGRLAASRKRGRVALAVSRQDLHAVSWVPGQDELVRLALSFPDAGEVTSFDRPEERVRYPLGELSEVRQWVQDATLVRAGGRKDGVTNVWLSSGERFVGALLSDEGALNFGPLQRPLARAVLDGPRAVVWGAAGFAKQSVNGGQLFTEFRIPYRSGDAGLADPLSGITEVEMGCGVAGCVLGPWLRWGWSADPLAEAGGGPLRPLPPQGGGRSRFVCGRGDVETPARRGSVNSDFPSFWEAPAPELEPRESGFSIGFSHDAARLYAMGPDASAWHDAGRLQLRFIDPYDPGRVLSTRPTVHVVDDRVEAETLFGVLDRTTSRAELSLAVDGRAGLVFLRTSAQAGLFRFQEDGPLAQIPLRDTDTGVTMTISALAGTVVSDGRWFFGFTEGRSHFVVAEARDAGVSVLARLPWGEASARGARLVSTDQGHLGVSMEGDRGLFVYPLSRQGKLGDALLLPHSAARPPACEPEAGGFLIDREYSLAPYLETPSGRTLSTSAPRALLRVGEGGPCLEGLTARSRSTIEVSETLPRTTANRVPLTLLSSDSGGNRVRLLCQ